ncbi:GNAT family N-acetyltransferase [Staphylococcus warneri]|uniref:GNAT family N-acetyltransferase n=1 Tax=Staphylococcus warneri TaxID=1292 RepID=UPI000D1D7B85|nr:N-acetyltransferase [Staphylococcus warneri]PTI95106.1 GNAT family N-acetyltransferase [Staphylococcus warneri]
MNFIIREEKKEDYKFTEDVIKKAFANEPYSNHDEHRLVSNLRNSDAFIPSLSLVTLHKNKIIGHILLSRVFIINNEKMIASLALAPVSVLPDYQNQGIGQSLIQKALNIATELNFESVIVMGHSEYYPKFGFKKASEWGIKSPFEAPDELVMAIELKKNALNGNEGIIQYSSPFFNDLKTLFKAE